MAVSTFQPQDSKFADRVRASFARQGAMRLIGATLDAVTPGFCAMSLVPRTTPATKRQSSEGVHAQLSVIDL